MKTCFIFLTWFILGVVVLLGLSNCNNSNLPANEISNVDSTTCLTTTDLIFKDSAIRDTQLYYNKVSRNPIPENIDGFNEVSFRISNDFIKAVDSLSTKGLIVLNPSSNDSAWIMPAMEKVGKSDKNRWEVVNYFACYSMVKEKKDSAIYFKIPSNPKKSLERISSSLAKANIDSLYKYRKSYFQQQKIFCPKGFGLPWCDMSNIYMSVTRKSSPEPKIKGVYAIKNNTQDSITLFLYTSKRPKSPKSNQTKKSRGKDASGGDEDGYYDFMFPCPNSCIP